MTAEAPTMATAEQVAELLNRGLDDAPEKPEDQDDAVREEPEEGAEPEAETLEAEPETEQETPQGITVKDLAERLEMDPGELYQQLRVGLKDNRGDITLEELKAGYLGHAEIEDERAELDLAKAEDAAVRRERESMDLRNRRELQMVLQFVQTLPDDLLKQAQESYKETVARESKALLDARPGFRDPDTYSNARARYLEVAQSLGFSEAEYATILDHRLLLALDELAELRSREAKAREALKAATETQKKRARKRPSQAQNGQTRITRPPRQQVSRDEQAAEVAALLNRGR